MTATLGLTAKESKRLARLENVVAKGLPTFQKVGAALGKIRDDRLWRFNYDSFEDYCLGRWRFTYRRANQLIAGDRKTKCLGTNGSQKIHNERQARDLAIQPSGGVAAGLSAEEQADGQMLIDAIDDFQRDVAADEAAARKLRTVDAKQRDRLGNIRRWLTKCVREIDGSIDCPLAIWLEAHLKEGLAKIEAYHVPLAS